MGTLSQYCCRGGVLDRISIAPKNLRLFAIFIGVYQVLVSAFVLFIVLLGLAHAEEMDSILQVDLAEHYVREDYITDMDIHGLPINDYRFKSAAELASTTLLVMYTASAISCIYALSSFCLLFGIMRNRSELMLPWLIVDMVGVLLTMDLMFLFSHGCSIIEWMGGMSNYWTLCGAILSFDIFTWFIVHAYYLTLCRMKKLNECAIIPIPCPAPGTFLGKSPYSSYQHHCNEKDAMILAVNSSP